MSNFFQVTKNLKNSTPQGRWLVIILLITSMLFIGLWSLVPLNTITTDQYAFLENLSTYLLISLIGALLLVEIVMKSHSSTSSILLGAALGMLVFINLFGLKMVDPTQIHWLMRGDWEWHFLGWHIFRHENWQFPLGKMVGFWYPVGTSIGYTDSIPLLAFLFKSVSAFLPADFQYIGLWLFTCFTLQGIFAALLLRQSSENLPLQAVGTLFFLLTPILVQRIAHPALCAHWLLLAALWLYFKPWDNTPTPSTFSSPTYRRLSSWLLLTSLSAAIHPYLTVMVLGLATAFYVRLWWVDHQDTLTSAFLSLVALGLATLLVWWQVGYFLISNNNLAGFGLGYYSMNLLSPFNAMGGGSLLFRDLPPATEGQYEGFNYLGAGVLLLGIWAVYELNKRFVQPATLKHLFPLLIVSLLLTILAISNKVTLGPLVLMEFHSELLEMLSIFRGTGRFFWSVHYLLLFLILSVLMRRNSGWATFTFLSLGLTLQVIDLWPIYQNHRQVRDTPAFHWNPNLPTWKNPLQAQIWQIATPHYQHITLVPPLACGEEAAPYQPFAYLAGRYGLTINTGHLARFDVAKTSQYCQHLFDNFHKGMVEHDTIYVVHSNYLSNFQKNAQVPVVCVKIDGFDTCVTKESYLKWKPDGTD